MRLQSQSDSPAATATPSVTYYTYYGAGDPNGGPGQLKTVTDALGNQTHYTYDDGMLATVTDPMGDVTNYFYDDVGNLTTVIDPLGNLSGYVYDNMGRLGAVIDPDNNHTASFHYDGDGNLTDVYDALGNHTNYQYQNHGDMDRMVQRVDALGVYRYYYYDPDGNRTGYIDGRGNYDDFQYDALNRMTCAAYEVLFNQVYAETVTYTYDTGDRVSGAVTAANTTPCTQSGQLVARTYDGLDDLTQETTTLSAGAGQASGVVNYSYDLAGRRSYMWITAPTPEPCQQSCETPPLVIG